MRGARLLLAVIAALAVSACARQQPTYYVMDPNTGQPVPVVNQQAYTTPSMPPDASPQMAQQGVSQQSDSRGLFSSSPAYAQQSYAQQSYAQQTYARPYQPPQTQPPAESGERGVFNSRQRAQTYAPQPYVQQQPSVQQPYVAQYGAPRYAPQPQYAPQPTPQYQQQGGRPPTLNSRPTRSTPATNCASWCSARTASPTATWSTPAAISACRWSAPCRRAETRPSSYRG
jgi:hypothetical protein